MQKHISAKKLDEFCGNNREKAVDLISRILENVDILPYGREEEYVAELIDINEMISILYSYDCDVKIESAGEQWYVNVSDIRTQAKELVDALFEAVVRII